MQPATARLNGSVGDSLAEGFGLMLEDMRSSGLDSRWTSAQLSATFTELSGSSTPKQRW